MNRSIVTTGQNRISQMSRGSVSKVRERHAYTFYSRTNITSDPEIRMFQDGVGQNSKTLADTNMQVGGQIPATQQFRILKFKCQVEGQILMTEIFFRDLVKWINSTVVELSIATSKILLQSKLGELLGNPWMVVVKPEVAANSCDNFSTLFKGELDISKAPIILGGTIPFDVRLKTFGSPDVQYIDAGDVKITLMMHGVREYLL